MPDANELNADGILEMIVAGVFLGLAILLVLYYVVSLFRFMRTKGKVRRGVAIHSMKYEHAEVLDTILHQKPCVTKEIGILVVGENEALFISLKSPFESGFRWATSWPYAVYFTKGSEHLQFRTPLAGLVWLLVVAVPLLLWEPWTVLPIGGFIYLNHFMERKRALRGLEAIRKGIINSTGPSPHAVP